MDRLDAMRVFTRVVERRSFTLAAEDTGLPRSTVTDAVKQLEARLGVRLLQRTTRHVSPTLDGQAYYARCLQILQDVAMSGLEITRGPVVTDALRFELGKPVDLDEWALSRKRLYDTNVFRLVEIQPAVSM